MPWIERSRGWITGIVICCAVTCAGAKSKSPSKKSSESTTSKTPAKEQPAREEPPQPIPGVMTVEEIQALADAKNYADALVQINKVLSIPADQRKGYRLDKLYTIRGDCQMQLKQFPAARDAYKAVISETSDTKRFNRGLAMSLLCQHAPQGIYIPRHPADKSAPSPRLDILSKDERNQALVALAHDDLLEAGPVAKRAKEIGRFSDVLAAMNMLVGANAAEMTATGKGAETEKPLIEVQNIAVNMLNLELEKLISDVQKIGGRANQWIHTIDAVTHATISWEKAGLTTAMTNTLRDDIARCKDAVPYVKSLQAMFGKKTKNTFSELAPAYDEIYKALNEVLTHKYWEDRH